MNVVRFVLYDYSRTFVGFIYDYMFVSAEVVESCSLTVTLQGRYNLHGFEYTFKLQEFGGSRNLFFRFFTFSE